MQEIVILITGGDNDMPFKSDAQRRYMYANHPDIAKRWSDKYNEGGSVMGGMMSKRDEDLTITRKLKDGTTVTIKSPADSQIEMTGLLKTMTGGGMIDAYSPSPVADDHQVNVTGGEYIVNQPAAQKYSGLLEKINNEGRQMLAEGGWTDGYAIGGPVMARRRTVAGGGAVNHPGTTSYVGGGRNTGGGRTLDSDSIDPQRYPPQVILDPSSSGQSEFQRMDELVRRGIYTIQQDNAGRAIYSLTDLGNAHNVRGFGSGIDKKFWAPGIENEARDQFLSGYQSGQEGGGFRYGDLGISDLQGRVQGGNVLAGRDLERRQQESIDQYGPTTAAPEATPEGTAIQYSAGQPYRVDSRQQAEYWVSQGIVEVGAVFIDNNGIRGVAQ